MDSHQIFDGTGGGNAAEVNSDNQLVVQTMSAIGQASLRGDAYAWNAVSANIDTTDCMILVANTSETRKLIISYCIFEGDIVGQMDFKLVDVTGLTLAGTAITGVNLNGSSSNSAPASAFADETASGATPIVMTWAQSLPYAGVAGIMNTMDFHDAIVCGYNDAFGIDTILEPAAGFEATVFGYFID